MDKQEHTTTSDAAEDLRLAARSGEIDQVNNILARVEDNDKKDSLLCAKDDLSGNTALHLCSANGFVDIAKMLLSHGAKPDERNKSGSTALHYACMTGQVEVARALLAYGADAFAENSFQRSVMDEALNGRHDDMVQFLRRFIECKQASAKAKDDDDDDDDDDNDNVTTQNEI